MVMLVAASSHFEESLQYKFVLVHKQIAILGKAAECPPCVSVVEKSGQFSAGRRQGRRQTASKRSARRMGVSPGALGKRVQARRPSFGYSDSFLISGSQKGLERARFVDESLFRPSAHVPGL